jgi:transcriptional regulator with XRE-family HTH domain
MACAIDWSSGDDVWRRAHVTVHLGTQRDVCGQEATMVDAPYTGDLDLGAVSTRDELAALLRMVHLRADRPSLRILEARTRHSPAPLSKTAVSEMLKGTRFPRKAVMVAFLVACGERDDQIEAWRRAWDRIAVGEHGLTRRGDSGSGPVPSARAAARSGGDAAGLGAAEVERLRAEVSRLSEDNSRLRLQMAAAGRSVTAPEARSGDGTGTRGVRGPEVRRRELGARLRALRVAKGMTIEQAADHLFCSPGKVSRMENGFRAGTLRDVRDLCELYGVSEADQRDELLEFARQSKQHGWWQDYGLPFSTYVGLEADAASVSSYHSTIVPGLLQTADYARAIHDGGTARSYDWEEIEQRVQVRLIRQRLLTQSDPPKFRAVLDEAVLHRVMGGPAVMAVQLDRLIELSRLRNVAIGVISFRSGAHPGGDGAFDILEFGASLPGVVYLEGLFGQIFVESPRDVGRYQSAFETLHAAALDQEDSQQLIRRIRRDLGETT